MATGLCEKSESKDFHSDYTSKLTEGENTNYPVKMKLVEETIEIYPQVLICNISQRGIGEHAVNEKFPDNIKH